LDQKEHIKPEWKVKSKQRKPDLAEKPQFGNPKYFGSVILITKGLFSKSHFKNILEIQ